MPKPKKPALNRSQAIRDYLAQNPKAKPKEIVAALKGKGVEVSFALAKMIRYSRKRGTSKPAGRPPGRPPSVSRKQARVAQAAKTGGVNKSAAVRAYLKQNPTASPKAIKNALKEKGIQISEGLASAVKYAKPKGRRPGRPKGRRPGRPPSAATNGMIRLEHLLEAKKLVERVGGLAAARRVIEILAQLS